MEEWIGRRRVEFGGHEGNSPLSPIRLPLLAKFVASATIYVLVIPKRRSRPLSNCVLNATCTDPVRSTPDTEASPLLFYEGHLHPPTQKPGRAAEVPSPSLSAVPPAFPCSSCLGCGSICPATSLSPGHPWEPPGEPDAFIPSNQSTQNEGGWDPDARSR